VRRFVKRVGADVLPALFAIREGDIAGRGFGEDPETELGELRRRIGEVAAEDAAMRVGDLALGGKDVMRILNLAPSRQIGVLLEKLLDRVLDQPSLNNPTDLERLLRELGADVNAATTPGTPPNAS
jgi:tRNA nucleotidyltransferase (CCA-adding enzyme)